jgi:hypothetical protein
MISHQAHLQPLARPRRKKYSFSQIDTNGFENLEDYINLLVKMKSHDRYINGKQVVDADLQALESYTFENTESYQFP